MKYLITCTFFLLLPVTLIADLPDGAVIQFDFNDEYPVYPDHSDTVRMVGVSPATDRFGNENFAVYLHGSRNSYINLGTGSLLKPAAGTFSLWFKMENVIYAGRGIEYNPLIITKAHGGDDFFEGYSVGYNFVTGRLSFGTAIGEPGQDIINSTELIQINKWYHLVIMFSDTAMRMYVDGKLQGSINKSFPIMYHTGDSVMIGNTANQKNDRYLNGIVDDFYFYDRMLSEEEVTALYKMPDPSRLRRTLTTIGYVAAVVMFLVASVWFIRRWHRMEMEKLRRRHNMELRIRRVQMNPHFIFNAMSAVQQLILKSENDLAIEYLGSFSKLLRRTIKSDEEFTSLDEEVEMLNRYIRLESLRFEHKLDYRIMIDSAVLQSKISIPRMLIQPLVENAIWHGLLPGKGKGEITVNFSLQSGKILACTIEDNGIGMKAGMPAANGHARSTGFIRERLALMQKTFGNQYSLTYTDILNAQGAVAGTRAVIMMPVLN